MKPYLFQKARKMGVPVSGTFELTRCCNLSCRMCYIKGDAEKVKHLDAETWIDLGRQAVEQGMLYLLLTGGEPLIRSDFAEIYQELFRMGLRISVNSNGTLLTEEHIQIFREYPPERINVTLYGYHGETYENLCGSGNGRYAEIVRENLEKLRQANIPVALNTTFTRWNLQEMEEIVSYARKKHFPIRTAGFLFPSSEEQGCEKRDLPFTPQETGKLLADFDRMTLETDVLEKRRQQIKEVLEQNSPVKAWEERAGLDCMAGNGSFWISYEGMMYPCGMLQEGVPVLECGLESAWQQIRECAGKMVFPEECRNCLKKRFCPVCMAVYESFEKDRRKLKEYMCVRTDTYMREL